MGCGYELMTAANQESSGIKSVIMGGAADLDLNVRLHCWRVQFTPIISYDMRGRGDIGKTIDMYVYNKVHMEVFYKIRVVRP